MEYPDPQELLRELLQYSRGRLKLYLGYAPGVGKTTRMLRDAQQLHQRGIDLVVGIVETHGRSEITQLLSDLEAIPLRSISYQGTIQTDLDLEAILKRRPATVLIDELAHTNAPGSLHHKRFEDVEALLNAGISVISALNIQHLEQAAETAGRLIGIPVHEVVPDRFLKQADEVQLVDASPETVLERLAKAQVPTGSPFLRRSTLVYLRELALRTVAEVVDADMLARQSGVSSPAGIRERLLVAVSTSPASTRLIRRGARMAEYLDAELFIVFVERGRPTDEKQSSVLQEHEQLSQQVGGQFVRLQGTNIAKTLIAFALEKSVTQVIVGESLRSPLEELVRGSVVNTLLRSTNSLDVLVVGETESVSIPSPPMPLPQRTCFLPTSQERRDRGFGRHKIYLGAAPGVGKTYTMLQEAHDLVAAGVDVVCGVIETHGRAETAALVEGLEVVPKRSIVYQGRIFQELDHEAVLARRPAVVLIDELAHTNVPGTDTTKRYQDVEILLAAGIEVISTLNIQHLESLNTLVERTTGVKVRETLPDLLVGCADEVVLIDLSTDELTQRLREGKIYAPAKVEQALSNFFRAENLIALRELALRELADDCTADTAQTDECVMVCVNLRPNARQLIRRGARIARRLGARLVVTYIHPARESLPISMREELDRLQQLSIELEGIFIEQSASDVSAQIVRLAQEQSATLLVLGEPRRSCWEEVLHGSVIEQVLRRSRNLDTLIVGNFERE
jgi:two-component system, OmpR family, sensor histidine kinase KdpD